MKSILSLALVLSLNTIVVLPKVNSSGNDTISNSSQIKINNNYAEKFCSAKADNFFKGLDNEKTLKYSYFRYIGFQNKNSHSMATY